MRHWIVSLFILIISTATFGQTPEGFTYQAVARDAAGDILANQTVGMQISILQGSVSGTTVFTETHTASSNSFGLINLVIGQGMTSDSFSTIDWTGGPYFIKIEMDVNGGTSYTEFGTSQLLSVPYSMHAKTAENTFSGNYSDLSGTPTLPSALSELTNDAGFITEATDADADPTNEIQDISLAGAELSISDGSTVDLGALPSVDTDDQTLALIGTELSIEDGNAVDLSSLSTEDTDNQTLSLIGTDLSIEDGNTIDLSSLPSIDTDDQTLSFTGTELTIEEGNTVDLGALDTDDQTLVLNNTELSIEGGNAIDLADIDTDDQTLSLVNTMLAIDGGNTIDLVSLKEDGDPDPNNEIQNLAIIGHELSITGGNSIILPDEVNDADADQENELQDLVLVDHELTISGRNMVVLPDNVNDADPDPANEIQNLTIIDHELSITGGNSIILPDEVNDPDSDPENELQDLVLVDHELTISGRNMVILPDNVDDADPDPTNELQTLILTDDILALDPGNQVDLNINFPDNNTLLGKDVGSAGTFNTFVGWNSGNQNITGEWNTFVGAQAGSSITSGQKNVFIGRASGFVTSTGISNTFLGYASGQMNSGGHSNTFIGSEAGWKSTASANTFVGYQSGKEVTTGGSNTFLGYNSGQNAGTGSNNVYLGYGTGQNNLNGAGNIFLGYRVGENETSSNKLLIGNTNPLIEGDFDTPRVSIFGNLGVGTSTPVSDFEVNSSGTGEDIVLIGISSSPNRLRISSGPNNVLLTSGPSYDGTKGLIINHTTGNVGVGLVPSTKLDVDGVITTPGGNSDDWSTAVGWGDHSGVGYLTIESQNLSEVLAHGSDAGGFGISNLADPIAEQDAATKSYVSLRVSTIGDTLLLGDNQWVIIPGISVANSGGGASVTDGDGNDYSFVTIGTQDWLYENLKTTKYNDGSIIPLVSDNSTWSSLSTHAYCWYDNNEATHKNTYGGLYNWYTASSNKLCPVGWHVPTDVDWTILSDFLGGVTVAGGKLKETGTTHWLSPNTNATNETAFTALPGGFRLWNGPFSAIADNGDWWTSTDENLTNAWSRTMFSYNGSIFRASRDKKQGKSVRCIRD